MTLERDAPGQDHEPQPERRHRSFWTHLYNVAFKIDWISVGGINTRYIEAGDPTRPAVIMLHGIAGSLENFVANIGPLARHFHVLAIDFVGTGLSDKPDKPLAIADYVAQVADFMDAKQIQRASRMGVSLGSWVSMAFYARHPERVEKLIMIASAGMMTSAARAGSIKANRMAAVNDPSWERMQDVFRALILDEENRIDDVLGMRQLIYQLPEMKRSMENIMTLLEPENAVPNLVPEAVWRSIGVPALFVDCPDSPDLSHEVVKKVKEISPGAEILTVRGAKHWPQFEQPDIFNDAVIEFLRR